ncbi:MAG: biopolymer transporter ExbD [Phycisphaerales bacterium]|nr:biopolymer transporter ExbD [Phycisphaerales bacterium]
MLIKPHTSRADVGVDLTPIIDIVFLLLIFFLVATTFQQTEREIDIALPDAQSGAPIAVALRELVINVDRNGAFVVSGRTVAPDDLRTIVQQAVGQNAEQKVTLRADRDAAWGAVAQALDICEAAGVEQPFVDFVPMQ